MQPGAGSRRTAYPKLGLLIGGAWRGSDECIPVHNPADGSVLGMLPCAGAKDVEDAIAAAERGFIS